MVKSKTDLFGSRSEIAALLPGYEPRAQQRSAALSIVDGLNNRGHITLIEAGTGVGKTLAYLIPALQHAKRDRKVVISTHTLALQAQLAEKDIPLVRQLHKKPFDFAVLKGRGNYLCLQDLEAARGDIWSVGDSQFTAISDWTTTTESGDVAELDFTYPGWIDIQANIDTCRGKECRYYDACFYYRMRSKAGEASLLLVNHALFFHDLAMRARGEEGTLIPDYDFVVFDEAHHMEATATAAFSVSFSSSRLPSLMEKLRRAGRGLDIDRDRLQSIETLSQALFLPFVRSSRQEFLVQDVLGGDAGLQAARVQVSAIGALLESMAAELLKQDTFGNPIAKERIDGLRRRCKRAKDELSLLFLHNDSNYLRWGSQFRGGRRGPQTTLHWTPISVAPLLAQAFWKAPRTTGAVLISATLATNNTFHYVRERLGIPAEDSAITETIVGSPFNYAKNCLLYIPVDMPPPSDDPIYTHQLADELTELVRASSGGAFLLFTSHRALQWAYDIMSAAALPWPLLRQGEMPTARLIEAFKEQPNAILFGTQSFWEGVDVPGDMLRLVVIDRIPFAMPDSPLHKARVEEITQAGGDWFKEFALPQAQLKLKQGFGRFAARPIPRSRASG